MGGMAAIAETDRIETPALSMDKVGLWRLPKSQNQINQSHTAPYGQIWACEDSFW